MFACCAGAKGGGAARDRGRQLAAAAWGGRPQEVSRLIGEGVSPDAVDKHSCPAVCNAARNGHLEVLEVLHQAGARLEATDAQHWTALIYAAFKGQPHCVEALLRWGADVNAATDEGNTALHRAAWNGKLDCARLLVGAGADRTRRNREGKTARQMLALDGEFAGERGPGVEIAALLDGVLEEAAEEGVPCPLEPEPKTPPPLRPRQRRSQQAAAEPQPEPEPQAGVGDPLAAVVAMGFTDSAAAAALASCGGDKERAIAKLLEAQEAEERRRQSQLAAQFRRQQPAASEQAARRCLETAGWDLQRAVGSYMPPVPSSPVSNRTLATSNFKTAYGRVQAPQGAFQLGAALTDIIRGYCEHEGIAWREDGEPFLQQLQEEAMRNMDDPIAEMLQRMWTSTLTLRSREFCFVFNHALRGDQPPLADPTAKLSRGINSLCVSVPPRPPFPPGDVCHRGGGFNDRYRSFFVPRRQFRQPAYLATSFSEDTAREFIRLRGGKDCVLWRVRIDPERKCTHVNLVKKTNVPGEEEYLFAPYSAFTVLSVQWKAGTVAEPHEIELLAAADNKREPEDLPLAPWA